jgi:hypothetical protein
MICLKQLGSVQSWLTCSDLPASADDRLLKAAAIEQCFVQIKKQRLKFHECIA